MRQLTFVEPGRLDWWDVPEPRLESPMEALVQPVAAGVCDYDRFIITGQTPLPGPIPLGHECVARVLTVGKDVGTVREGDLVVVPYHVTCGVCGSCRRGLTARCQSVPPVSVYGFGQTGGSWGGMYSDVLRVPYADGMLVPIPEGFAPETLASCGDNVTVGWCAVAPTLQRAHDATVLVVGGGMASTGLYAAAVAVSLGAAQVNYLDTEPDRLARAQAVGARAIEGSPAERHGPYTLTVDASMTAEGLACAVRSTEAEGTCHSPRSESCQFLTTASRNAAPSNDILRHPGRWMSFASRLEERPGILGAAGTAGAPAAMRGSESRGARACARRRGGGSRISRGAHSWMRRRAARVRSPAA